MIIRSRHTCPYNTYPDAQFWARSVSRLDYTQVDPVSRPGFKLDPSSKIATAGSCFAQNLARVLKQSGYSYFVTEQAPPVFLPETAAKFAFPQDIGERYGYGLFSARFGNIYTARQLLQLFDRAYRDFTPVDDAWATADGWVDPYRPFIQPDAFPSIEALHADRERHFAAVRRMIEDCDAFIFTLGLTEAWTNRADGAVYPVCPGCGAGEFSEADHAFFNFDYEETLADMRAFLERFRAKNPRAQVILTVSPVPLVATAEDRHVIVSTMESKAVLRAVAGKLDRQGLATYFPSYEIITGPQNRSRYFEEDLRGITAEGVGHVMRVFFKDFCGDNAEAMAALPSPIVHPDEDAAPVSSAPPASLGAALSPAQAATMRAICDEENLAL